MKILLTGHSGFLGRYLYGQLCLQNEVLTLSRNNADICCDLSDTIPDLNTKVDLVVHNAGKAHQVPKTEEEKNLFGKVNREGTKKLCHALEAVGLPKQIIFISTIAVYGLDSGSMVDEEHSLNAKDPYGKSKREAESFLIDWCNKKGVILTVLRLPLVVGIKPPGNLGSMIRAISSGCYVSFGDGAIRRSAVLASDIATLISSKIKPGIYNLCDGIHPSFREYEEAISKHFQKKKPFLAPIFLLKIAAYLGDLFSFFPINSYKLNKLSNSLTVSDALARKELNWQPSSVLGGLFK